MEVCFAFVCAFKSNNFFVYYLICLNSIIHIKGCTNKKSSTFPFINLNYWRWISNCVTRFPIELNLHLYFANLFIHAASGFFALTNGVFCFLPSHMAPWHHCRSLFPFISGTVFSLRHGTWPNSVVPRRVLIDCRSVIGMFDWSLGISLFAFWLAYLNFTCFYFGDPVLMGFKF